MGHKRFWILDFGFWIEELIGNLNRKSQTAKHCERSAATSKIGWGMGHSALGLSEAEVWGIRH